jgi:hypothetical protein
MGSKRPQTMAKRAREQAVREKRDLKRAKKAAAKNGDLIDDNGVVIGKIEDNSLMPLEGELDESLAPLEGEADAGAGVEDAVADEEERGQPE